MTEKQRVDVTIDGKEIVLAIVVKRIHQGYDIQVNAEGISKANAAGILAQMAAAWYEEAAEQS